MLGSDLETNYSQFFYSPGLSRLQLEKGLKLEYNQLLSHTFQLITH